MTDATFNVLSSPSNRHLLFYGRCLNDSRILAKDDKGQWAEEHLNWSDNSSSRVITQANFSACTNRLLTCGQGCVNTLRLAHRCWNDVDKITLWNQTVQFSTSGKYMVTFNWYDSVIVWRMDENNDWLKMEVCGLSPGMLVQRALFSPSEQYLVLYRMAGEMALLTLDDRDVWSAQQLILSTKDFIASARFSPVADQLLVGFASPGQTSIYSLEPSGKWEQTMIIPNFCELHFSPAGKYVYCKYDHRRSRDLLLWRSLEKLPDGSLSNLRLPQSDAVSTVRLDPAIVLKHDSPVEMAQFSPSDSHLLATCGLSTIIWRQSQAEKWSAQTITDEYAPTIIPCFSLSGLHVLTCNPSRVGILGSSDQKHWSLKGVIEQDGIVKACFNSLSEHEVVVLSRTTDGDITNITLQVWEIRDAGTPD